MTRMLLAPANTVLMRDPAGRFRRNRHMRMRGVLGLLVALAVVAAPVAPAKTPPTSPKQMKAIVHAWSDKLNAGDNQGVAHLFRLPAIVVQNYAFRFHTYAQIAEWHSYLPCAGHITSVQVKGRYATAVFRLGNRKGRSATRPARSRPRSSRSWAARSRAGSRCRCRRSRPTPTSSDAVRVSSPSR